jgi:hypothetical protein
MTGIRLHIICERDVGLFSLIQQAIANIAWALHEKRIPIVYFGPRNCYWTPNHYRGRDTVWEYYFEPVISEYSISSVPEHVRQIIARNPPNLNKFGYFVDENTFVSNNFGTHRGFSGKSLPIPHEFDDPDGVLRRKASQLISAYVRPRAEILRKTNKFFLKHLEGRHVIGVHLRGTDALVHPARAKVGNYLDFSRYYVRIKELLSVNPNAIIFVAADADSSVLKMREMFGDRVVANDTFRHQSGDLAGRGPTGGTMPAYLTRNPDVAARAGEDAIIDYLLLSRCNHLVHNGASLARTVMLKVPELPTSSTLPQPSYFKRKTYYLSLRFRAIRRAIPTPSQLKRRAYLLLLRCRAVRG